MKNLFKTKKVLIIFTTLVFVSFFGKTVFAVWNNTFYNPGDTLDPECLPTDVDCDVLIPAGHDAVTLGTANGLSLSTQVLSLALASTSTTGALSSADWNTFNNKQPAGSYLTSLSGAVLLDQSSPQTIGTSSDRLARLWATDISSSTISAGTSETYGALTASGGTSFSLIPSYGIASLGRIAGPNGWDGSGFLFTNSTTGDGGFSMVYNVDKAWFGILRPSGTTLLGTWDANGFVSSVNISGPNLSGTNTGDNAVNSLYSGLAGSKQDALSGTGFVKISGTTISYDNSTYVTGTPWTSMGYLTSLTGAALLDQTTPQTIGTTTNRLSKLWTTDLTVTNAITGSVTGNAGTVTGLTITPGASISNSNTGDNAVNSLYSGLAASKQDALSGTGFVKISGTTISYDNSSYITSATVASNYVPYTGAVSSLDLGSNSLTAGAGTFSGTLRAQGSVTESTLNIDRIDLGVQAGTPRMVFENSGFTTWEIDNESGKFRWFTPGIERLSLDSSGNLSLVTGALQINGTSVISSARALQNITGITTTGSLTMSGSSANIILGSNYLSGDGDDEGIYVDSTGNVGIGTNSPGSNLDVKGTIRLSGSSSGYVGFAAASAAGSTTYTLPSSDGTGGYVLSTNGSGVLSWVSNGSGAQTPWTGNINAAGFTLNGNSTASGNLTLDSTSHATKGYVLINPSGGNVGIGTASPGAKLHVLGSGTLNTAEVVTTDVLVQGATNAIGAAGSPTNLSIQSNSTLATDAGGTLGLSGRYTGTSAATFAIVKGAKENATDGNYAGYLAFATRPNGSALAERMRISSTGNVGIGNANPTNLTDGYGASSQISKMWISDTTSTKYTSAVINGPTDGGSLLTLATGGSTRAVIGYNDAGNSFDILNYISGEPIVFYTNSGSGPAERMRILSSGNVGIKNPSPGYLLHVGSSSVTDGTILLRLEDSNSACDFTANAGAPTCGSDETLKKNINDQKDNLSKILALRPVTYNWLTDQDGGEVKHGFIAQEVAKVMPELVTDGVWIDGSTKKFLQTAGMTPYIIGAIQELNINLESLTLPITEDNKSQTFTERFFAKLTAWLADAGNGVAKIFTGEVDTKSLCVSDDTGAKTCITKAQLDALILQAGSSAPTSTSVPIPAPDSTPTPDPTPTPVSDPTSASEPISSSDPAPAPVSDPAPAPTL